MPRVPTDHTWRRAFAVWRLLTALFIDAPSFLIDSSKLSGDEAGMAREAREQIKWSEGMLVLCWSRSARSWSHCDRRFSLSFVQVTFRCSS